MARKDVLDGNASVFPQSHRLEFLDACRGVAAIAVVVYHFFGTRAPWLYAVTNDFENLGAFGVSVFFLISGFIIPVSLQRYSFRQFWRSRFFRLVPAYWFSLALLLTCGFAGLTALNAAFLHGDRVAYLTNLTMLAMAAHQPAINGVAWTLTVELLFYVLCSLMKAAGWLVHRLVAAYAGLIVFVLFRLLDLCGSGVPHIKAEWAVFLVAALVGSVFYDVHRSRLHARVLYPLVPAFLLAAYLSMRISAVQSGVVTTELTGSTTTFITTWVLTFLFFCLMFWQRGRKFPKVLLWVGRVSYSLYLMHGIAGALTERVIGHHSFTPLVQMAAALLLADFCYRLIERPSLRLARGSHRNETAGVSAPILSS